MAKALLIIDVQYDFLPPSGSLAVTDGDKIIPLINQLKKEVKWDLVVKSQDWHPKGHKSFSSSWVGKKDVNGNDIVAGAIHEIDLRGTKETLWPDHCVQGSHGAEFSTDLVRDEKDVVVRKGQNPEIDSYSAFADNNVSSITELYGILDKHGITTVYVCGIATDFCVNFTCRDATVRKDDPNKKPFKTFLIKDASRGVAPESSEQAVKELQLHPYNVIVVNTSDVLHCT